MKHIGIIIIVIFFGCGKEIKNKKANKEIDVNIVMKNNKFLCISLVNNTKDNIYIPNCSDLSFGLKIFGIGAKNNFIDLTNKVIMYSTFYYNDEKEYQYIRKCCNMSENIPSINKRDRDSIASCITKKINNRDSRLLLKTKKWVSRELENVILIESGKSFTDFFSLSDSINYRRIIVYYLYPYSYPLIKNGPGALDKDLFIYNIKMMDSLRFEYPNNINGYKLYNKVILSKPIFFERK